MSRYRALSAALLTLGVSGCGTDATSTKPVEPQDAGGTARDLTVVVQANVHGDIEPCG